jgi:hypothetical protein
MSQKPTKFEQLEDFFTKHPEDAQYEIEKPLEALQADSTEMDKFLFGDNKKTDFEKECDQGEKKAVKDIRAWVRQDNDVVLCVDGREGVGKSFWTIIKFAKKLDPVFTLEKNVLFRPTPESLEERIFSIRQYGVLVLDETMETLYKRLSMTSGNIGINRLFGRVRKFNRIVILILPNFDDLDSFFRERRVKVRVNIVTRGLGFLMVSKDVVGNDDPWFSTYNKKILEDAEKDGLDLAKATASELMAVYRRFKCFQTPILWDELPEDAAEWARYKQLAIDSQLNAKMEEAIKGEKLPKAEKAYRGLFIALSRRLMEEHTYTHEETFILLQKMYGTALPFDIKTFRFMTKDDKKQEKQRKSQARMVEHTMITTPSKPKGILEGI